MIGHYLHSTQSDNLQVHSENCVVFLLSAWMNGRQLGQEQRKGLASCVRVINLSWSYLTTVVPKLDLFEGCDGMGSLQHLLLFKAAKLSCKHGLDIPANWLSTPRKTVSGILPQLLSVSIDFEEVKKIGGGSWVTSALRYCNGFFFFLSVDMGGEEGRRTLGAYLHVQKSALRSDNGGGAAVQFHIVSEGRKGKLDGMLVCGLGLGRHDCLGRTGATLEEAVAPFMKDGKMEIYVEITDVQ